MKNRNEIDEKYKWNVSAMYPDEADWEKDMDRCAELASAFAGYRGRLTGDAGTLLSALKDMEELERTFERVYVYARMKRDEDNRVSRYQSMTDRCAARAAEINAATAFFTPELLADAGKVRKFMDEEEGFAVYEHLLTDILRKKEHVLSDDQEEIIARFSELMNGPDDIFTMLNNADLSFGEIDGEPLTHGNYIKFMEDHDRNTRKRAYEAMYRTYESHINTIAAAYGYSVRGDVLMARLRRFPSARAAALDADLIPEEVYDNLVEVTRSYLPALHRYLRLRKKLLGLDELKMYDVYVPLVRMPEKKVSFEDSVDTVSEALAPMGQEYVDILRRGIEERWVDVYENEGKTSGAYSFGSYDSYPYVLMNHSGTLQDTFTLIHELGHSMHSLYTRRNQPFIYGSHSIFTAEVASTVNECLLMKHLLSREKDGDMRRYLINMNIESFRTTLFRQVMFAEFEHLAHRTVEEGGMLTAEYLSDEYDRLNSEYFGDALSHDDMIGYEWARIPHFYNAYYVYQYATGYSAACALSESILNEGPDRYIGFLKSGSSAHPITLLREAGVDMADPAPVRKALDQFTALTDEFERLSDDKES